MKPFDHRHLGVMRRFLIAGMLFAGSLALVIGCSATDDATSTSSSETGGSSDHKGNDASTSVTAGTMLPVTLGTTISSKTANSGDTWNGTITENVTTATGVVIPAGSAVTGVVVSAKDAQRGDRAMLDLAVRSVEVDGQRKSINASTEAVVAGSPRARNLGAIAGGAAAGALIGKAAADKPGTGAIIGGVAAGAAVAASKGFQVVLKEGTHLTFTVNETVSMR